MSDQELEEMIKEFKKFEEREEEIYNLLQKGATKEQWEEFITLQKLILNIQLEFMKKRIEYLKEREVEPKDE